MLHRRSIAIPALLLAVTGALTSCGFDYQTDRVNQIAAGDNNRDAQVDALGILIVASGDGQGRLIGTLVNNHNDEAATLDAVSGGDGSVTAELEPVEVLPNKLVNLSGDVEIPVTGEFAAGDVVPMLFEFSTGESVDLNVPVVKQCYQYAEVEVPGAGEPSDAESDAATGSETEADTEAESDSAIESEGAVAEESEDAHAEDEGDATYTCAEDLPAPAEEH
jgi:hypothetical protein